MSNWSGSGGGGSGTGNLSGTLAEMLASTPAAGTLFWNTTYNAQFIYSNNRWFPVVIDPRYGFSLYEEFSSGTNTYDLNWTVAGTVLTTVGGEAITPGITAIRATAASARSSLSTRSDSVVLGTMDLYMEWMVRFPTLATAGDDYCAAFGLSDAAAYDANSAAVDGTYFTYNRAVNGANWNTHTASNSVLTNTTNLSSAVAASTWYRLGILITAGTSVDFYVNGVNVKQHTTNIPTGASRFTGYQARLDKSAGTGNSDAQIDYFMSWGFFNSARVS